jgi:lipoyl(octanoyl) transferase
MLVVRQLGHRAYQPVWEEMRAFTEQRNEKTLDELWLVEHPPVYTQGLNGKAEHLLNPGDIPVIQVDRGGQVTYHGPGQIVAYILMDLDRRGWGVRHLVRQLEQSIIDVLAGFGIDANGKPDAPGVYINEAKIASLGLRVRRGRSYHGLSLNVDMDLEPFSRINPCGYKGLTVVQLKDLLDTVDISGIQRQLVQHLARNLGYNNTKYDPVAGKAGKASSKKSSTGHFDNVD